MNYPETLYHPKIENGKKKQLKKASYTTRYLLNWFIIIVVLGRLSDLFHDLALVR